MRKEIASINNEQISTECQPACSALPRTNTRVNRTILIFALFGASLSAEAGKGGKGGGPPNRAPGIEGTPATSVAVGSLYDFLPTASDPDGDPLTFSIANQPAWTSFDPATGRIFGTPGATDMGVFSAITVSVSDGAEASSLAPFSIEVVDEAANQPPQIGGNPPTEVMVGETYAFTPTASDPNGDQLTFSVDNKPGWTTFSTSDGTLSGTPADADIGVTSSVTISVSDAQTQISLAPFDLMVQSEGSGEGTATLSWTAPTERVDGSPLTNIAGYGIAYGKTSGEYSQLVEVHNPGITTYVIDNLNHGTWFFAVYVYDEYGLSSDYSNEGSKEIPKSGGPGPGKGKK